MMFKKNRNIYGINIMKWDSFWLCLLGFGPPGNALVPRILDKERAAVAGSEHAQEWK